MPDAPARLRHPVAIAGVGQSAATRKPGLTRLALAAESVRAALADAGLALSDCDGLIVPGGSPYGCDYDELTKGLGISARFCSQLWSHGRMTIPAVIQAALVIDAGLANVVIMPRVCAYATPLAPTSRASYEFRELDGPHGENPAYGLRAPIGGAGMTLQRYLTRYGGRAEQLAAIPVAFRRHASLNPNAAYREPITTEDYLAARSAVEPLRVYDCAAVTDGAVCLILTSLERARACRARPVSVAGFQGVHGGRGEAAFALPGLGTLHQDTYDYEPDDLSVYAMAGITRADIDVLGVMDSFTPQVLSTLERFGFTRAGETLDWIQDGRIELGGELPLNTSGGHLSEGYLCGMGHIAEGVRQLRGECGERQVKGARLFQYAHSAGDAVILAA
jgi:acetyl-CoA acetyltransferase